MPVFCLLTLGRHGNFTAGVTMEQPDLLCIALALNIEYYRWCRFIDVILEILIYQVATDHVYGDISIALLVLARNVSESRKLDPRPHFCQKSKDYVRLAYN